MRQTQGSNGISPGHPTFWVWRMLCRKLKGKVYGGPYFGGFKNLMAIRRRAGQFFGYFAISLLPAGSVAIITRYETYLIPGETLIPGGRGCVGGGPFRPGIGYSPYLSITELRVKILDAVEDFKKNDMSELHAAIQKFPERDEGTRKRRENFRMEIIDP